jgi:hypothetical protein
VTTSRTAPSLERELSKLKTRVATLEKRLADAQRVTLEEKVFTVSGELVYFESRPSPPYQVRRSHTIGEVVGLVGTASSSGSAVVHVRRNGTTVHSITLAEGSLRIATTVSIPLKIDDVVTAVVVDGGTDTENLTVILRFRR